MPYISRSSKVVLALVVVVLVAGLGWYFTHALSTPASVATTGTTTPAGTGTTTPTTVPTLPGTHSLAPVSVLSLNNQVIDLRVGAAITLDPLPGKNVTYNVKMTRKGVVQSGVLKTHTGYVPIIVAMKKGRTTLTVSASHVKATFVIVVIKK